MTLTCVAAADSPQPIEDHVYAALNSGDIELEEMLEFILQFAVLLRLAEGRSLRGSRPPAVGSCAGRAGPGGGTLAGALERRPRVQRLEEED